jgi:energy-coupling factor transport system permease protein
MTGSTYVPGNTLFHRADPRLKLLMMMVWVLFFVLSSHFAVQGAYFLLLVLLLALGRSVRVLFIALRSIWPILLLVLLLTPPFHGGGDPLFHIGGLYRVSTGGLAEAGLLILRFSGIATLFLVFFRTTPIDRFILTLRWYGLPYSAALVVTIAFRYIPSFIQVYRNIQDAHALRRARSVGGGSFNPVKKISGIFPTLVSVMIHSVKGIPTLSMALETRGFGRNNPRSSYLQLPPLKKIVHQLPFFSIVLLLVGLLYFL